MSPASLPLPLDPAYIGATYVLIVRMYDGDVSTPLDMTGRALSLALDRKGVASGVSGGRVHIDLEAVESEAEPGVMVFTVEPEDTEDWVKGNYACEFRLTDDDAVRPVLTGVLPILSGAANEGHDTAGARQDSGITGLVIAAAGVAQLVLAPSGLNGKSAYQVAVANGYEGTEEEYAQGPIDAAAAATAATAQTALALTATTSATAAASSANTAASAANTAADGADTAAAYALASGRVVALVADLEDIVSPAIGWGARVVADPLGDVEDGNGDWSWSGSAWVWIGPLVYPPIDAFIDQVETDVVETIETVNLYVPAAKQIDYLVNSSTGNRTSSAGWACSDWIPVTEGEEYTISANAAKRGGLSFFTSYGATTAIPGSVNNTSDLPLTVTAPAGATHLLVNVLHPATPEPSEIMINAGDTALPYEAAFDPYFMVRESALPEQVRTLREELETDILTTIHPVNRYNTADRIEGSYITGTGSISTNAEWGMVYIDVTDLEVVTISANSARRAGSAFYTTEGSGGFMSGTYSSSSARPETRDVPDGAVLLGVNLYSNTIAEPTEFIVSASDGPVPYEAWEAPRLGVRADSVAADSEAAYDPTPRMVLIGTDGAGYVESGMSGTPIRRGLTPYFTPSLIAYPSRMQVVSDSVDGVEVRASGDDIAPDHVEGQTLGGNHGYNLGTCTATGHGKAEADEGSTWTNGGSTYVLVKVSSSGVLLLARTDTNASPPTGTFVHAAGATNTGNITVSAVVDTQWYPPHNNYALRCLVDGREVTDTSGIWEYDQSVQFVETCDILPRAEIIAWWIANGGASGGMIPDGDPLYTMTTTYRFDRDAQLTIHRDWFFYEDTTVADLMGLQVGRAGAPTTYYIPGAEPFTYDGETVNYGLGVASGRTLSAAGTPDIDFGASKLQASGEYAHRVLSLWADYVFAVGFLPVGDAALDVRRARVSGQALEIRGSSAKLYFRVLDIGGGTIPAGSSYSCVAYRHILPRVAARTSSYVVRQSDAVAYVYVDWHDKDGFDRLDLPSDLIGRSLTVIDSRNATLAGGLSAGSLVAEIDAAGDYGYLVVRAG